VENVDIIPFFSKIAVLIKIKPVKIAGIQQPLFWGVTLCHGRKYLRSIILYDLFFIVEGIHLKTVSSITAISSAVNPLSP